MIPTRSHAVLATMALLAASACTVQATDGRGRTTGSPVSEGEASKPAPSGAGSSVPSALVGRWFQGNLAATQLYDPVAGTWAPTQGTGIFYVFEPDGSYRHGAILNTSVGACHSQLVVDERGTVSANEAAMTLSRTSGRSRVDNSCGADAERVLEPEERLRGWRIVRENAKEKLVLVWPDQATDVFERWVE